MKKLFHWVLCHSVFLVLLAFLVFAVVFREPLFGISASLPVNTHKETAVLMPPENSDPESIQTEAVETVINAETADEIQQREQYDFRPPEVSAVEEPAAGETGNDLLQMARKAFWNDQLDSAQEFYLAYIEQNPSNPDGYGELGNLLSTLGELDDAAEMYLFAAELLKQQGKSEEALQLQEVVESIRVIQTTH